MRRPGWLEPAVLFLYLSWLAPAMGAPNGPSTAQLLEELERDTAHHGAIAGAVEKAKAALTRARSMEQAGDARHGAALRAVAREWVDCARDLVRTSDAEASAEKSEKTADDLETKRARGSALLEETIARRGRAQALLQQLEQDAKTPPPTAPNADVNAGTKTKKSKAIPAKPAPVNE